MFSLFRTLTLRYLWKHWVRAGLVIASIALGVGTWVATESLYASLSNALRQAASPLRGNADFYVTNTAAQYIDASLADRIKQKVRGVQHVEPFLLANISVMREGPLPAGESLPKQPAAMIGLKLPEQEEEQKRLEDRDIEVVDLDRAALEQAYLLSKAPDLVWPALWRPFARRAFERYARQVPVLVGDKLHEEFFPAEEKPQTVPTPGVWQRFVGAALKLKAPQKTLVLETNGRWLTAVVVGKIRARKAAAALGGHVVLLEWQPAARLLRKAGKVQRLDVTLYPDADPKRALEETREVVGDAANVQTAEDQDKRVGHVVKGIETSFRVCGAGALVVGLFLVYNAMSVSVTERRHDIGILRSIGATRTQVRGFFLAEAMLMGVAGSLIGLPLGVVIAQMALGPIQDLLKGVFLALPRSDVQPSPGLLLTAFLAGLNTAWVAAVVPASKAAKEQPADAVRRAPPSGGLVYRLLQLGLSLTLVFLGIFLIAAKPYLTPNLVLQVCLGLCFAGLLLALVGYRISRTEPLIEGPVPSNKGSLLSRVCGVVFSLIGVAGTLMRDSLAKEKGSYAAVVLILLGALLLTPILSAFLTRLLQRTTRSFLPIESRLAVDNLVRSPGRTGLVIAALTACVALTVATAGMIKSNKAAFTTWIDDTLKADLSLYSARPGDSTGSSRSLPPQLVQDLFKDGLLPEGTKLVGLAYRYPEWNPGKRKASPDSADDNDATLIFLALIDARAHYELNRDRDMPAAHLELWRRLATEPGTAVVSDNFALMHGVKVGDTIPVGKSSWRVLGTIPDYNWIRGSIWVDRAANVAEFEASEVSTFEVYLPPEWRDRVEEVRDRILKSRYGAQNALIGLTREEVREASLSVVYNIYAVAYTQEIVVGVVAILGVVTALLISVLGRQRELGLLRAVGATRVQVLHTVLAEAVLIGLVGTLLGILIGLPLEWYYVRVILFEEAGFLFPVRIPWAETFVITGLAVVSATIAGLAPAIQAIRLRIADAIAYE